MNYATLRRRESALALTQGLTFVASGVWPVLHMRSFEAVTGPKVDRWLVKTVGLLISGIGGSLLLGRRQASRSLRFLAAGSAAALGTIDGVYAGKGRISNVYFADMAMETMFAAAWAGLEVARRRMKMSTQNERKKQGEAAGRERGYEAGGGKPGNRPLEDGQLRGANEEGKPMTGTHGGPGKEKPKAPPTTPSTGG